MRMVDIPAPQLPAPSGVTASNGLYTDRILLTWVTVAGATGYEIWRSTDNSLTSATRIAIVTGPPYNDTTATPERTYYYWIIAIGSSGYSTSTPVTGRQEIANPINVSASDGTYTDRVRISWSLVSGADNYTVYRAATPSGSKLSIGSAASGNYYDDFSAAEKSTYYYFVTAGNSYGSSDYSTPDTGYVRALSRIYRL
jgi:hypothetical protein